jgi:short-subunit dehydrogenase
MAEMLDVVTGASSGIGLSLAKELAGRGYDFVVCSAGERLGAVAEELKEFSVAVHEVQADLATRDAIDAFWNGVTKLGRTVDIACLNAGDGSQHRRNPARLFLWIAQRARRGFSQFCAKGHLKQIGGGCRITL